MPHLHTLTCDNSPCLVAHAGMLACPVCTACTMLAPPSAHNMRDAYTMGTSRAATERGDFESVVVEYRKARALTATLAQSSPIWQNLFLEVDKVRSCGARVPAQ